MGDDKPHKNPHCNEKRKTFDDCDSLDESQTLHKHLKHEFTKHDNGSGRRWDGKKGRKEDSRSHRSVSSDSSEEEEKVVMSPWFVKLMA